MNGSSTNADDDIDGMLDMWELQYFGSLSAQPNGDSDADGVSNLNEFLEGTGRRINVVPPAPHDSGDQRRRQRQPASRSYTQGDVVTLTATPNGGYQFVSWGGQVSGMNNPWS